MLRALLVLMAVAIGTVPGRADDSGAAGNAAMRSVIQQQIDAFRADDGPLAFGYASPTIRKLFATPENFMAMVQRSYAPVYRPQRLSFGRFEADAPGGPAQHVIILGPDGKTYDAVYSLQRQPDGSWKINGCALAELPGLAA
jgi:hypothetical protein